MRVCDGCIEDADLQDWIQASDQTGKCDYCGARRAWVVAIDDLTDYMRTCIEKFWGDANEQLPYESREGGYQGRTWVTWEILFDEIELSLPNDSENKLAHDLCDGIGDDVWCDFDWLRLDDDVAMKFSWEEFCEVIKHQRRFFFHLVRKPVDETEDRQILDPADTLEQIYRELVRNRRIKIIQADTPLYRARPHAQGVQYNTLEELGPPPKELALQANRMNPPGVPMMYLAESLETAVAEVRTNCASVGHFRLTRNIHVIDLADIVVPGTFSNSGRRKIMGAQFLRYFVHEITQPVVRNDESVHLDYLPTQVVTEFFRTKRHGEEPILGVRYPSSLDTSSCNLVLFLTQEDLQGQHSAEGQPLLVLESVSEFARTSTKDSNYPRRSLPARKIKVPKNRKNEKR